MKLNKKGQATISQDLIDWLLFTAIFLAIGAVALRLISATLS